MYRLLIACSLLAVSAASPHVVKSRAEIEDYKAALEKSREDDGLNLEDRMEAHPQQTAWASSGKFQGDMLLDEKQIEEMVEEYSSGRNAYVRHNSWWPHATAVYEFAHGEFDYEQQRYILGVMDVLSQRTCVRFRPRNANDRDYVRITGGPGGCYASVGYDQNRGAHTLNLARAPPGHGCLNFVIIAHEWLHVLGFFHMQSTYNRYDYVRINWENVQNGMQHNFYRYDPNIVNNLGLPYEYGSCMHYGTHFFSSNGQPTLTPTRHYDGTLGQTHEITGFDLWRLNRHYNCPGAWSSDALEKARSTVYVENEEGKIVEQQAYMPLADELELLEEEDIIEE